MTLFTAFLFKDLSKVEVHVTVTKDGEFLFQYLIAEQLMEQLLLIVQQIQTLLDILNGYIHDEKEELVAGVPTSPF